MFCKCIHQDTTARKWIICGNSRGQLLVALYQPLKQFTVEPIFRLTGVEDGTMPNGRWIEPDTKLFKIELLQFNFHTATMPKDSVTWTTFASRFRNSEKSSNAFCTLTLTHITAMVWKVPLHTQSGRSRYPFTSLRVDSIRIRAVWTIAVRVMDEDMLQIFHIVAALVAACLLSILRSK